MKKESKIGYDGRNLMTRIPKEIEKEANLKKGDKLDWEVKKGKLRISKKDLINANQVQKCECCKTTDLGEDHATAKDGSVLCGNCSEEKK